MGFSFRYNTICLGLFLTERFKRVLLQTAIIVSREANFTPCLESLTLTVLFFFIEPLE